MEEKYIFVKSYSNDEGTIPQGTELYIFRGQIYMNGGLVAPSYQNFLMNFISNNTLRNEYLEKHRLFKNKI